MVFVASPSSLYFVESCISFNPFLCHLFLAVGEYFFIHSSSPYSAAHLST